MLKEINRRAFLKASAVAGTLFLAGDLRCVNPFTGAKEERIRRTVADVKAITPDHIIPMHCTGFETMAAIAKEMPDQFILNTVGTKYIFTS